MARIDGSLQVRMFAAPASRRWAQAVALCLPAALLAGCETPQERVAGREDHLAASGFVVRPADTPERQAMLDRLPANRFVVRDHGGTVSYVYADPLVCDCLYVGTEQAYDSYRAAQQQRRIADEQALAAASYSDAAWNWGPWGYGGPGYYGPFGPEYGFGGGFGF